MCFLGTLTDVVTGGGDGRRGGRHGPARCGNAAGRGYGRRNAQVVMAARRALRALRLPTPLRPSPPLPRRRRRWRPRTTSCSPRQAEVFAGAFQDLSQVAGAQPVGWKMTTDAVRHAARGHGRGGPSIRRTAWAARWPTAASAPWGSVAYLDDAAFDDYAKSLGLTRRLSRSGAPAGHRLAQGYGNNGSVYQLLNVLREPGTLRPFGGDLSRRAGGGHRRRRNIRRGQC